MAGVYTVLATFEFANTDQIQINHNLGLERTLIKCVVDGQSARNVVKTTTLDRDDPKNALSVRLVSPQSGVIQILDSDLIEANMPVAQEKIAAQTSSVHKLDATSNPTVSNDSTEGYDVNSTWININTEDIFICVDATQDAAVWKNTSQADSGGDFSVGGDSEGSSRTLGNNDGYALGLKTDGVERIHLAANGDTGLGTTSPQSRVHIKGDTASQEVLVVQAAPAQTANLIEAQSSDDTPIFVLGPNGDIPTVGQVDGRDIATDGSNLDTHIGETSNPHNTGINNLYDVNLTSLTDNEVLVSSSGEFQNTPFTKGSLGLGNVDNVQQIPLSQKGASGGVATLNGSGELTEAQIPASLLNGLKPKGAWDASTNSPTLSNSGGGGTSGDFYIVSAAGSTSLDGETDWEIGDWALHNGSIWQKIDHSDQQVTVNGKNGPVITLDTDDIDEGSSNLWYTEGRVTANTTVAANTTHRGLSNNPHGTGVSNLNDTTIASLTDDEMLVSSGGSWLNRTYAEAGLATTMDLNTHISNQDNPHGLDKNDIQLGNVPNLKVNLTAVTLPTANDDVTQGYAVGSLWVDTVTEDAYTCLDASSGAALWKRTTEIPGVASAYYDVYNAVSSPTDIGATAQTLTLDTPRESSGPSDFTLINSEVTVLNPDLYIIDLSVSLGTVSGTSRTTARSYLEMDTGGGFILVPGSDIYTYHRQSNAGNTSGSAHLALSIPAGAKFRIRSVRTAGTGPVQSLSNGTSLRFLAVSSVGPQGPQGPSGAPGDLNWQGAWSGATAYAQNDTVEYQGSTYRCSTNNTNQSPFEGSTYWDVVAKKGDTGAGGTLDALSDTALTSPTVGDVLYFDGNDWVDQPISTLAPIFGSNYAHEESLGVSQTTSTNFQQKASLSTGTIPAGTYRLGWSYNWGHTEDNGSDYFSARIQLDNSSTVMSHDQKDAYRSDEDNNRTGGFVNVTFGSSGSYTFDLDYKTSSSNETSTISNVSLEFWRVL